MCEYSNRMCKNTRRIESDFHGEINILWFENWKEVLPWKEKRCAARREKICFHVWPLGMDCGHHPPWGQSCLPITLAQHHRERTDGMFCNCSQVSHYINILSSESIKRRIFVTYFFSISSLFFTHQCLMKYFLVGT